jgi:hypothetical protein
MSLIKTIFIRYRILPKIEMILHFHFIYLFFETGSYYVAQAA